MDELEEDYSLEERQYQGYDEDWWYGVHCGWIEVDFYEERDYAI